MNLTQKLSMSGHLECWARLKDGTRIKVVDVHNLVVDEGLDLLPERLAGTSSLYVTHAEIGYGTTAPLPSDTALGSAILRKTVTSTFPGTGSVKFEWTTAFNEGNSPGTISEAGLFTASSGPTMFNRATFSAITKDEDVELDWAWTITFQSA